jgi:hypothetical protein
MRRPPKREAAGFCAGSISETQSMVRKIFNNEQVTCVGARVVGKAMKESDHALIFIYKIDWEQGSAFS